MTKAFALGDLLQFRAGVCDGDEAVPRLVSADGLFHPLEEVLHEDIRLESSPRLARHNEERIRGIDLAFARLDLRWVCRVEDQQLGVAIDLTKCHLQNFR